MSTTENLAYTVVQVLHNFGAVATVGSTLAAARYRGVDFRNKLTWLALAGWGTQAASGAAFGLFSYYFHQRLPDISGIALGALQVKIICAASGFLLTLAYLVRGMKWPDRRKDAVWFFSSALAVIALTAAAILRWFS